MLNRKQKEVIAALTDKNAVGLYAIEIYSCTDDEKRYATFGKGIGSTLYLALDEETANEFLEYNAFRLEAHRGDKAKVVVINAKDLCAWLVESEQTQIIVNTPDDAIVLEAKKHMKKVFEHVNKKAQEGEE